MPVELPFPLTETVGFVQEMGVGAVATAEQFVKGPFRVREMAAQKLLDSFATGKTDEIDEVA